MRSLVAVRVIRWRALVDARHNADGNAGQPRLCAAGAVRYAAIPYRVI
jgi:hypothetical protein